MIRALLAPLLCLAAAPATAAPTDPVATLAPDAEARWVAFDLTPGNQIRFIAHIDGRAVVAILDTGVSHTVVAERWAIAQKLAVRREGSAQAIGGAVDLGWAASGEIAIGALTQRGGRLVVAALPAGATGTAAPVDLLVGRDLLAAHALEIDYAQHRFRLLPSGRMPFAGKAAPLAIAPDRMVYVTTIALGTARLRPMVVDTGDGAAVTLSAAAWQEAGPPALVTTDTVAYGLLGPVVSDIAVARLLSVGDTIARDVEVRIEPADGFSQTIGVAGRIGSAFLQNYHVLLDPKAGRMVLAPVAAPQPTQRSTSGLLLGLAGDRLRVLHVMRGGPGEKAGWRTGEEICAVDGIKVATMDQTRAGGWAAGKPGTVVRLTPCGATAARTLRLRRFY